MSEILPIQSTFISVLKVHYYITDCAGSVCVNLDLPVYFLGLITSDFMRIVCAEDCGA